MSASEQIDQRSVGPRRSISLADLLLVVILAVLALRSAWAANPSPSGVTLLAPGDRVLETGPDDQGISYLGLMGDVPVQCGQVYSSHEANLSLSDLLQSAADVSDSTTGMAYIVRNGRCDVRIPWPAGSNDRLLPGDLVVFHTDGAARQHDPRAESESNRDTSDADSVKLPAEETVQVALVGIFHRRPVVVALDKRFADVPRIVEALRQPPEVARPVRVICTDGRLDLDGLVPRDPPAQLADGDVLIFDRRYMDIAALEEAEPFPDAIPLLPESAADQPEDRESTTDQTVTASAEQPARERNVHEVDEQSSGAENVSTEGQFDESSAPPLLDVPVADQVDMEAGQEGELTNTPQETFAHLSQEPSGQIVDEPVEETKTANFEAAADTSGIMQTTNLVPAPVELKKTTRAAETQGLLATAGTATIAVGVLALAGLCFLVAVFWSRIDRTAQSLQQPLPTRSLAAEDAMLQRRRLERLIENQMPMVEERAPLPDRMDYHGKERGRRRLMIDQPHGLAGPHFTVGAQPASSAPPQSLDTSTVDTAASHVGQPDVETRLQQVADQERQYRMPHSPGQPGQQHDNAGADDARPSVPQPHHRPRQPVDQERRQSGLLERVLIAMERERRQ